MSSPYDEGYIDAERDIFSDLERLVIPAIQDACSRCNEATNYHPLHHYDCCDWRHMTGRCGFARLIYYIFEGE